jgi:hypothetical protein
MLIERRRYLGQSGRRRFDETDSEWIEGYSRSLHSATPDFLLTLVASVHSMRPSLRKGAHAFLSSAAWQEIRVRSGRDDNSVWNTQANELK